MEAGVQIFLKILFAFSQLKLSLTVLGIENIKLFSRLIGECFDSIEINHIFGKTPISQIWNQDRSQVLGLEVFLVVGGGLVIVFQAAATVVLTTSDSVAIVKMWVSTRFPARPPIASASAGGLSVTAARMIGLIRGWVRKPTGSLSGEGTGLLRPSKLESWSRAIVATLPVRTSMRFWMIPLLSLLLAVLVLVKTSTKAVVVVAGEEVVLVLVEVVESPPPSKPKPRSPPSGAAETMHKTGRRLTKYILGF